MVRALYVVPFVEHLWRLGAPGSQLPEQLGITAAILEDPEGLVPVHRAWELLGRASEIEGRSGLGLAVGAATPIEKLGAYGRIIRRSSTLDEAIRSASELLATQQSAAELWLEIHGESCRLCHRFTHSVQCGRQQADHYSLSFLISVVRVGAGPGWIPERVSLQTGEWSDFAAIGVPAETEIHCNQSETSITFRASLLSTRLPGDKRSTLRGTDGDRDQLIHSGPSTDFEESVQQLIRFLLRAGSIGIGEAARDAGMSVRTFQRRLAAVGLSYSEAVERIRFATAKSLLQNPELNLGQIGRRLGYSDHASFTHAFRQWSGLVPRDYRRLVNRD